MGWKSSMPHAVTTVALVVSFGGVGTPSVTAEISPFPIPSGAVLELRADGLEGDAGNTLQFGGTSTPLSQDVTGFAPVQVTLPPDLLRAGRVDVALVAGNVGAAQGEGYDDFLVRDVQLVLADGTVVRDERYTAGRPYHVGDGLSTSEDPADVLSSVPNFDYFGTRLAQTPEVLRREFRFQLPLVGRSTADAPEVPKVEVDGGAVRVTVADPDGGSVDLQLLAADEADLVSVQAGTGYSKPHEATPGATTVALADADPAAVRSAGGSALETEAIRGFPTQEFSFRVDPATVSQVPHLEVVWQGRTTEGSGATLYVRDLRRGIWAEVASTPDAGAGTVLTGAIDTASTVAADGTVRLQVQEERFLPEEGEFSIAWLTDTQFYSERFPQIYDSMNRWIVENQEEENIVYAVHTGDITQNYNEFPWEWPRASDSMKILEDGGVPYGIVTGNHDIGSSVPGVDDHVFYDQFFPASRFEGDVDEGFRYGGHYGTNNRNHYDLVSYGGYDFLYLYLDWAAGAPEIAWANQVLQAHPNHHAVINTHQYINPAGAYTKDGARFFQEIVVPNDNVFMVLSGHHTGAAYNVRRVPLAGGGERIVMEVLHDYQGGPDGGSGYLRLVRFDLDGLQMDQQPYSPYTDDFDYAAERNNGGIPEEHDDYTLSLDIGTVERTIATDRIAVLVRTGDVVASADDVISGGQVSVSLPADLPDAFVVRLIDPAGGVSESRPHLTH